MTHVTSRIFDEIALSGCPVVTYDLVTDILLSIVTNYYYNNHSPLQTSNIRYFSVTYKAHAECLIVHIECDDDRVYVVAITLERLKSYGRYIK